MVWNKLILCDIFFWGRFLSHLTWFLQNCPKFTQWGNEINVSQIGQVASGNMFFLPPDWTAINSVPFTFFEALDGSAWVYLGLSPLPVTVANEGL